MRDWHESSPSNHHLLDGCRGSSFLQLLDDLFGFFFRAAFLHGLRCALNEFLGFLQAKSGDCSNFLDHVDLLLTSSIKDNVKFGLLFGCGLATASTTRTR